MTRTKKILACLLVVLLLLMLTAYFVGNHLLDGYSRQAMTAIAKRSKRHGVVIEKPSFQQARISGFKTARWTDVRARLSFPQNDAFDPNQVFDVRVGQAELWLSGDGQVTLEARDVTIDSLSEEDAADDSLHERIRVQQFRCQFDMELFNPLPGLESVLPELVGLMKAGATQIPILAEGELEFSLQEKPVKVRVRVDEVEGGQSLVLDTEDLRPLSDMFDEALTDAEIELISTYPLRVPQLLRIKEDAESTAEAAKASDQQVPQDAYRHVLWSFLLTNEYDAAFAQQVTDAHEEGDTGNTPAERDMDYNNNAIGRRFSQQKVRRNQILARVQSDADVIREPR